MQIELVKLKKNKAFFKKKEKINYMEKSCIFSPFAFLLIFNSIFRKNILRTIIY